jgi:hypothetical protein
MFLNEHVTGTSKSSMQPKATSGEPSPLRRTAPAAIIIILAGILAYHNSLHGPFIFDDFKSIVSNQTIRHLRPLWEVLAPPGRWVAVQNRPIVNLSLAINYAIGDLDVLGYHVFNLAVHILAALTLFGIIQRTLLLPRLPERLAGTATPLALITALIWTVHPLQTEAVTYVIQRTESMMGLFYLLTLYCVIRGAWASRPGRWYLAAVAACAIGTSCKEVIVSAPLVVLLYDRVFLSRSFKEVFRRRWPLYVGLAATWVLLAALVLPAGGRGTAPGVDPWQAVRCYGLTQFVVVARYLGLCFWPHPLILDYGVCPIDKVALSLPHAIFIVLLLVATVLALRYRPWLGFLGAWFFVILAPSSSVVPLMAQSAAEKRMYLPLAAVVAGAVVCAYVLGQHLWDRLGCPDNLRKVAGRRVGLALAGATVLSLGVLTVKRNGDYRSELAIWQDTVRKLPGNWRAWYHRGVAHAKQGNHDQAISDYNQAIELSPTFAATYKDRGKAYGAKGEDGKAINDFTTAIRLNPEFAWAYYYRGNAWARRNNHGRAASDYTTAIELSPKFALAYMNRAVVYTAMRRYEKAWGDVDACRRLGGKINPTFLAVLSKISPRRQ